MPFLFGNVLLWADRTHFRVAASVWSKDISAKQSGSLGGVVNFFGILCATISPFISGVVATATHAFVVPLEVAAAVILVAEAVAGIFLKIKPRNELVSQP